MTCRVTGLRTYKRFDKDLKSAPPDVQAAAKEALRLLMQNPVPRKLRPHALKGYKNPKILKIDVFANKAWQITFEMDGETAILRRLGRHKDIDDAP